MIEALEIQARAAPNAFFKEELTTMIDIVRQGGQLTQSAGAASVLPDLVERMIRVGEETAELDRMLLQAAEFYEQEVEELTSVLEPILIVLIGAVLGFLLVALYLPMFDLSGLAG